MSKIFFTDEVMNDKEKLAEHLQMMQQATGTQRTKPVQRVINTVQRIISGTTPVPGAESVDDYRLQVVAVTAGVNVVTFSSALPSALYEFSRCDFINADGDLSPAYSMVSSPTAAGFTLTAPEAGNVYYHVKMKK